MKKIKYFVIFLCFLSIFVTTGCCDKELSSAKIVRDDARTGGSLSFVYDQKERLVSVGGKGEVVQYSLADESKNLDAGCRVGLKVVAPDENVDVENAVLEMNGVTYSSGNFLENIDGQKQRFFNIYPVFSKDNMKQKFVIKWQDGTKKQEYKIEIVDGTKFMDKDGNVN